MTTRPIVLWLVAAALVAGACGGGSSTDTTAPEAEQLLADAADAMEALTSAAFDMTRSGEPVVISGMEFLSARGQYGAPDSTQALLEMRASEITVELGTISIGDVTWLTNPLTGGWEELPEGTGFNPAILFEPEIGWRPLLTEDISNVTVADGGDGTWKVSGTVAAERVEVITAGLVSDQEVEADIWIDRETSQVERIEFSTEGEEGTSDWVLELSEFDEPVSIDPPDSSG